MQATCIRVENELSSFAQIEMCVEEGRVFSPYFFFKIYREALPR